MGSLSIVKVHPLVHIDLQLLQAAVHLVPESSGVKLVLNRLVESLTEAIGLRALGLGSSMLDVFQIQVQRVRVVLTIAAVLTAPVSQEAQQRDALLLVPR